MKCDACNIPQFDTIPGAHVVTCQKRAPFLYLERLTAPEIRRMLPSLQDAEGKARAARLPDVGNVTLREQHENTVRALRAATDTLAKHTPQRGPRRSAAVAAQSWKNR